MDESIYTPLNRQSILYLAAGVSLNVPGYLLLKLSSYRILTIRFRNSMLIKIPQPIIFFIFLQQLQLHADNEMETAKTAGKFPPEEAKDTPWDKGISYDQNVDSSGVKLHPEIASGFPVTAKILANDVLDEGLEESYASHRIRVVPGAEFPFIAGLDCSAIVLPDSLGQNREILVQSTHFAAAWTRLGVTAPSSEDGSFVAAVFPECSNHIFGEVEVESLFRLRHSQRKGCLLGTVRNPSGGGRFLAELRPKPGVAFGFQTVRRLSCGVNKKSFSEAYRDSRLSFADDFDGDGITDLLLVSKRSNESYFPDYPDNFWQRKSLPNTGPGRGYTVNGRWLGGEEISTFHWSKGFLDDEENLSFGEMLPVYQGGIDYPLQWKGYSHVKAAVIEVRGQKHFLMTGDLDRVLAAPIRIDGNAIYCGTAESILGEATRLKQIFLPLSIDVADMDGDGVDEIVLAGNPGTICILSGTEIGKFSERPLMTKGGSLGMQTLIVPTRIDWESDGKPDIIAGDASGYLKLWPGTEDPLIYGEPLQFRVDGVPVHIQAGHSGSIQGPNEARWGYLNPVAGDWDGDGKQEIITCDINGDLLLWKRARGAMDLQTPKKFTMNGAPLPVAWRTRPAFVAQAEGNRSGLILLDYEGDLALAVPHEAGGTEIEYLKKLKYENGNAIRLSGSDGTWGRAKFLWTDWDGDGVMDIVFGTNRACIPFFAPSLDGENAMPFLLRNCGTSVSPVFEAAVPILLKGAIMDFGTHIAAPEILELRNGKKILLVGAEDGRIYAFPREELTP